MKKSTVGIVLLVALVVTKAFLTDYNSTTDNLSARTETVPSTVFETMDLRADHLFEFTTNPMANLVAFNMTAPDLPSYQLSLTIESDDNSLPAEVEIALPAVVKANKELDEEVLPMDYFSNTGYNLWKKREEKLKPKKDREGKVSLAGENTISDSISKLFPRLPR